jgi:hypothetical protein
VFDHSLAEISEHTQQGFLPDVIRYVNGSEPGYGLDPDKVAEILCKVLLGCIVAFSKPPNVLRVK